MKKRRRLYVQIIVLVLGLSLSLLGILLLVFLDPIHDGIIKTAMNFKEGSASYTAWLSNNPPLDMDVYLFNWTNPEDIRDPDIKPKFDRLGPYRFKECRTKINITWNDNKTVSFRHRKMYHFNEKESVRPLEDMITTVNAVSLTIGYKVRYSGYFPRKAISYSLSSLSSVEVTEPAGKILFDGFDDSILSILNLASFGEIKDKFGLFYGTNGSEGKDGYYNMHYENDDKFGAIATWNYRNTTDFYTGHCNDIKGSAGEFYSINQKKDQIVFYSPELCRYAVMEYVGEVMVKGIRGYKYTGNYIFDNGTLRPENRCFCNGECNPSGVFNVSLCRQGSPTFLSFPNFYHADPYYTDAIEGVIPNKERDEFYIVLEPKTGIVIDLAARMQLNMLLQPIQDILLFEKVQKVYVPIFYFDQKISIKDHLVTSIKILQHFPEICTGVSTTFMTIGILILVGLFVHFYYDCACAKKKYQIEQVKKPVSMQDISVAHGAPAKY
ncbi:protein croquemort-like isoform X2 [Harmonia axyridis]|nr:protein croquemort-like isoform X2 [Harmonia axyridis]XP_045473992.1 protein croquemort-like isoform X2 [Harmonia axyridis]